MTELINRILPSHQKRTTFSTKHLSFGSSEAVDETWHISPKE